MTLSLRTSVPMNIGLCKYHVKKKIPHCLFYWILARCHSSVTVKKMFCPLAGRNFTYIAKLHLPLPYITTRSDDLGSQSKSLGCLFFQKVRDKPKHNT